MRFYSIVLAGLAGAFALSAQSTGPSAATGLTAGESAPAAVRAIDPQDWTRAWAHVLEDRDPLEGVQAARRENPVLYARAGAPGMPQVPPPRPRAITYSNAFYTRLKIHRYASYATLPLFVSEIIVGEKLYDNPNERGALRSAHSGLAAGIGVLFGLNTVTGIWNMREMRHDPNGRRRRLIHEILMLTADGGFFATAALAPGHERPGHPLDTTRRAAHRAVALTSIGVGTAGYLYMLVTR